MMSKDYSFCFQTHTHRKYYNVGCYCKTLLFFCKYKVNFFTDSNEKKKIEKKTHFFNNIFLCARRLPGRYFRDDSMQ